MVSVPLQGVIPVGTQYELRDAQNFFGAPLLSGVYDGSPLSVPTVSRPPAAPVGLNAPAPTGPDFQVFIVIPTTPPYSPRESVRRPSTAPKPPKTADRSPEAP